MFCRHVTRVWTVQQIPTTLGRFHINLPGHVVFTLSIMVLIAMANPPLHAATQSRLNIVYDSQLQLSVGTEGRLRPSAVTWDPISGEITVTESRQVGIHIFNPAGIEVFRSSRFAGLVGPLDAAVDTKGRTVYLARVAGLDHELRRLNLYGEPDQYTAKTPNADFDPQHLIVTGDGHYLSLDVGTGAIVKNDSRTGAIIWTRSLGEDHSTEAGVLHLGRPVESPDGRIAIPGGELRRILVLSADGEPVASFGRFGSSPGRLVFPVGAVFRPDGRLLVLDRMRHKILIYGADYRFENEFGSLGDRPGQFYHPVSMAGTNDGRLFVAQGYRGRVQVFNILDSEDH